MAHERGKKSSLNLLFFRYVLFHVNDLSCIKTVCFHTANMILSCTFKALEQD